MKMEEEQCDSDFQLPKDLTIVKRTSKRIIIESMQDEIEAEPKRPCKRKDDGNSSTKDDAEDLQSSSAPASPWHDVKTTRSDKIKGNPEERITSSAPPESCTELVDKQQNKNDDHDRQTDKLDVTDTTIHDEPSNTDSTDDNTSAENDLLTAKRFSQSPHEIISDEVELSRMSRNVEITDSQLVSAANTISNGITQGNGGMAGVTSLLKGLITELSSLNRFILDSNKQMEAARRQRQETLRKLKIRVKSGHKRH